ncbi:MAG: hypothetical protein AAGD11_09120 [Planctomycetota bacterium]
MLNEQVSVSTRPSTGAPWVARVLRIEWLGQTIASLCWIASVFAYGISSSGDWLQLGAASAWFVANVASAVSSEAD